MPTVPLKIEVMLDLETMSSKRNAAIVAIGAVKMDMRAVDHAQHLNAGHPDLPSGEAPPFIVDSFAIGVNLKSCQAVGLHVDGDTVMWWLRQSDAARVALCPTGNEKDLPTLYDALLKFNAWFGLDSLPVWGNGSDFDNVILANAYDAIGAPPPWKYSHNRCFRTLKNLVPPTATLAPPPNEKAHDALADATWQAQYLFNIQKHLGWAL